MLKFHFNNTLHKFKQEFITNQSNFCFSNQIKRNDFKVIDENDIKHFEIILGENNVIKDSNELKKYNTDWLNLFIGSSKVVLNPKTTTEVSKILSYCNSQRIGVTPQGGNTSLCGGSVPVFDEVILNFQKMNKIINFDPISSTLHCEAGCILQTLNEFVEKQGFTMPIDLGAKGSCFIGGNLSTNAGGIHFVQHGSLRSNCKGIKAVIADGTVIENMLPLPKNNTGYDLKQLFIGSEGTLGVITECLIHCPRKLKFSEVALIGVNKFEDVIKIYQLSKNIIGNNLSAIEFFDSDSLKLIEKHTANRSPINKQYPFYILIESSSNTDDNKDALQKLFEKIELDSDFDGIISEGENQFKKIWEIREDLGAVTVKEGITLSYDFSLNLKDFYKLVDMTRETLKGHPVVVTGFGHIGDYNLHLMVSYNKSVKDEEFKKIESIMEPWIFNKLGEFKGSISAEHGVGLHKIDYLNLTQQDTSINLMKSLKRVMDPNNILNPYKLYKI